jgi:hypothetical protein
MRFQVRRTAAAARGHANQKLAETVQLHDADIKVISRVLQQMIEKPIAPQRQIGFHTNKDAD